MLLSSNPMYRYAACRVAFSSFSYFPHSQYSLPLPPGLDNTCAPLPLLTSDGNCLYHVYTQVSPLCVPGLDVCVDVYNVQEARKVNSHFFESSFFLHPLCPSLENIHDCRMVVNGDELVLFQDEALGSLLNDTRVRRSMTLVLQAPNAETCWRRAEWPSEGVMGGRCLVRA